jgi:lipopolysaccharide export system permease protein
MIYRRALVRELGFGTAAALVVLIAIALITLFIRLLGDVARGELANEAVFTFLGFALLRYLPVLLTMALFLGVMMTLSRMWRDNEMTIWLASGVALTRWIRPVLSFALPILVVMTLLSMYVIPWALDLRSRYSAELHSRSAEASITPGLFAESNGGKRVYFVEALNPLTGTVRGVFLQTRDRGRLDLVVAREGRQRIEPNGTRYLVLDQGRRYELVEGQLDVTAASFERYWMRLDPVAVAEETRSDAQERTSVLLRARTPRADAELVWRTRPPLSALVLVLLAIPLSYVNTRARRAYGVVVALLMYFIYNNLLSLSQAWVQQGKLGFWPGALTVHLLMLGVVVLLFYWRTVPQPWWKRAR